MQVVLRQSWNNLVDLPSNVVSLLYNASVSPQEVIIEILLHSGNKSYVGWSGMNSQSPMTIGIDPAFSQSLVLVENQKVTINLMIQNVKSSKIMLEPETFADWELVELHAAFIESKLIEQSRCVAVNQTLVVYPTRTSSVRLQVKDIGLSNHFALIDPFAEVSISPKKNERKVPNHVQSKNGIKTHLEETVPSTSLLKRGISTPSLIFPDISDNSGYELYANQQEFSHVLGKCEYVSVSIIAGPNDKANRLVPLHSNNQRDVPRDSEKSKPVTTIMENKQIVARIVHSCTCPKNTVGLSTKLAIALNVENILGYKVVIKQVSRTVSKIPSSFIIHPFVSKGKKIHNLKLSKKDQNEYSQKISQFMFPENFLMSPVSNFCKIPSIPKLLPHGGILLFKRNVDPCAWIKLSNRTSPKTWQKFELGEPIPRLPSDLQDKVEDTGLNVMYGVDQLLGDLTQHLTTFRNTGVMLHGTLGSGKSATLKFLSKKMKEEYGMFTNYVACETLMNENSDQLRIRMKKWTHEAVWNQPSVIILDNFDKILSAEVENTDSSISDQLTEYFISLMRSISCQKSTNVSMVISGSSKESFNKLVVQSHLLEKYFHIAVPNKSTRAKILEEYISGKLTCTLTFDLMDIVLETEGYLPNDLKTLSDRIYYESIRRDQKTTLCGSNEGLKVMRSDFETALHGFKPSSLRGVKLEKSGANWEDIGGMFDAKRVLLETLEWPTKYAPIFASCPLRLRSGLLLYGYPGCGKTLLASAIAGQCGLNFISIKGPEILNKYIGASEQSVRELFERAQAAKPCILFFDEFDSIAPKRGHDSTGVTDRVVNQMLTQMDGAEGLDGVYVLAATSRPDLIDSALLRPGRLDKSIFCDMPNYHDRLNILTCISNKMNLREDVQLNDIASKTEGFSGADLQGLGYNAYLKAVHEKLTSEENVANRETNGPKYDHDFFLIDSEKHKTKIRPADKVAILHQIDSIIEKLGEQKCVLEDKTDSTESQVWINQSHFMDSLTESKLSISSSEKTKLNKVYSEFLTGRDGTMPDGSASQDIGGRTTLM